MADVKTVAQRSQNMRRIRRRDSKAELSLRQMLFGRGLRFRVDYGMVVGRPDVCFPKQRVAIFVDSVFWHGLLPRKRIARMSPYWREKLERNRRRDDAVNAQLLDDGWCIIRIPERAALRNARAVSSYVAEVLASPHSGIVVLNDDGRAD